MSDLAFLKVHLGFGGKRSVEWMAKLQTTVSVKNVCDQQTRDDKEVILTTHWCNSSTTYHHVRHVFTCVAKSLEMRGGGQFQFRQVLFQQFLFRHFLYRHNYRISDMVRNRDKAHLWLRQIQTVSLLPQTIDVPGNKRWDENKTTLKKEKVEKIKKNVCKRWIKNVADICHESNYYLCTLSHM